jgi:ribosomal protein L32
MFNIFKKKEGDQDTKKKEDQPKEAHVICPNCFMDFPVSKIVDAGNKCPSCGKAIDPDKLRKAVL